MSHDELRAEYERLKAQVAELLQGNPLRETENPDLRQLLEKLQALTEEYEHKARRAEAQIAELKRELFGPKSDRLTPEQAGTTRRKLNQDLEAEAQRPDAASDGVLDEDEEEQEKSAAGPPPPRRATSPAGAPRDRDRHD